jgi:hypothetical protein
MESGTRPRLSPPVGTHLTQCASSAHWHHLWNQVRTPELAPPAGTHFTKGTSSAHWHHLWNQVRAQDWLHLLVLTLLNAHPAHWHHLWNQVRTLDWLHLLAPTLLNTHPALTGTIYEIRYTPRLAIPVGTHFTQKASSAHWHHLWNQVRAPDWLHLLALTLLNAHPALTGTIYGIRYAPKIGSTCWCSLY